MTVKIAFKILIISRMMVFFRLLLGLLVELLQFKVFFRFQNVFRILIFYKIIKNFKALLLCVYSVSQ